MFIANSKSAHELLLSESANPGDFVSFVGGAAGFAPGATAGWGAKGAACGDFNVRGTDASLRLAATHNTLRRGAGTPTSSSPISSSTLTITEETEQAASPGTRTMAHQAAPPAGPGAIPHRSWVTGSRGGVIVL